MGAVKKFAVLILLCWAPVAYAQGGDMEYHTETAQA